MSPAGGVGGFCRPFAFATFRSASRREAVKAVRAFQRTPEGLGLDWLVATCYDGRSLCRGSKTMHPVLPFRGTFLPQNYPGQQERQDAHKDYLESRCKTTRFYLRGLCMARPRRAIGIGDNSSTPGPNTGNMFRLWSETPRLRHLASTIL